MDAQKIRIVKGTAGGEAAKGLAALFGGVTILGSVLLVPLAIVFPPLLIGLAVGGLGGGVFAALGARQVPCPACGGTQLVFPGARRGVGTGGCKHRIEVEWAEAPSPHLAAWLAKREVRP